MFAFQYCKVPNSDKSILHFEFLGCIAESDVEDSNVMGVVETESNSNAVDTHHNNNAGNSNLNANNNTTMDSTTAASTSTSTRMKRENVDRVGDGEDHGKKRQRR